MIQENPAHLTLETVWFLIPHCYDNARFKYVRHPTMLLPWDEMWGEFSFFAQISKKAIEKQRKAGMKDLNGAYIHVQGVHLFEKSARIGILFVLWGWENGVKVPR